MADLRLFAAAREAAGTAREQIPGSTVAEVLAEASTRFGEDFAAVLAASRIWRNGLPALRSDTVSESDEVAVIPPVSGGC